MKHTTYDLVVELIRRIEGRNGVEFVPEATLQQLFVSLTKELCGMDYAKH